MSTRKKPQVKDKSKLRKNRESIEDQDDLEEKSIQNLQDADFKKFLGCG